jgi:hypothetical protein
MERRPNLPDESELYFGLIFMLVTTECPSVKYDLRRERFNGAREKG